MQDIDRQGHADIGRCATGGRVRTRIALHAEIRMDIDIAGHSKRDGLSRGQADDRLGRDVGNRQGEGGNQ